MTRTNDDIRALTLRPHTHLFRQLLTVTVILVVPVFAVLYWLTIPAGTWPIVVAAQVLILIAVVIAIVAERHVYVQLHDWGVEDHWPFGFTTRVRTGDVDTILLLDLYRGGDAETHPQLFAVDGKDRLVLRMRGQIWSRTAIQQVAARLGAPVVHSSAPMSLADFTRIEPRLLAWFERRPIWRTRRRATVVARQPVGD